MTKLLEQAFAEASKLSEAEQDSFAERLLAELHSDRQWDEAFAQSGDLLGRLAEEALAQHRAGLTQPLVRLVPMQVRKKRQFGSAKGLIEIADDLDLGEVV